jgi:Uma2 family endonuclease
MAIGKKLMTTDELLRLPEDGMRYELVAGKLRAMAPSGGLPNWIAMRVALSLGSYVDDRQLGLVLGVDGGYKLAENPDTVRAPDVSFVRRERALGTAEDPHFWTVVPDLVVEVISPSDLYTEVEEKVAEWLAFGVAMVVVVNPRRRTVAVHRPGQPMRLLTENDVLDGEDVVPGWRLPVRDVFRHRLAD